MFAVFCCFLENLQSLKAERTGKPRALNKKRRVIEPGNIRQGRRCPKLSSMPCSQGMVTPWEYGRYLGLAMLTSYTVYTCFSIWSCVFQIYMAYRCIQYDVYKNIGRTCLVAPMLLLSRMRSVCIQLNMNVIRGLVKRAQLLWHVHNCWETCTTSLKRAHIEYLKTLGGAVKHVIHILYIIYTYNYIYIYICHIKCIYIYTIYIIYIYILYIYIFCMYMYMDMCMIPRTLLYTLHCVTLR